MTAVCVSYKFLYSVLEYTENPRPIDPDSCVLDHVAQWLCVCVYLMFQLTVVLNDDIKTAEFIPSDGVLFLYTVFAEEDESYDDN